MEIFKGEGDSMHELNTMRMPADRLLLAQGAVSIRVAIGSIAVHTALLVGVATEFSFVRAHDHQRLAEENKNGEWVVRKAWAAASDGAFCTDEAIGTDDAFRMDAAFRAVPDSVSGALLRSLLFGSGCTVGDCARCFLACGFNACAGADAA